MGSQTQFRAGTTRIRAFLKIAGFAVLAAFLCTGCGDKNNDPPAPQEKTGAPYLITFDPNGGTLPAEYTSDTTRANGKLASLPTPVYEGHTLKGWFTADTNGIRVDTNYIFIKDTTIYAQWISDSAGGGGGTKKTSFLITFDPNGGTAAYTSDSTGANGKLASLPTPGYDGHTFNGWFTAKTDGTIIDTGKVYSANDTLYAQWTPLTYAVTFNTLGGSDVAPLSVAHGGKVTEPANDPTHTNGTYFDGWFKEEACTTPWDFNVDTVTADVTLYAKWSTTLTHRVTFNTLGGTEVSHQTIEDGGKATQPPNPTPPAGKYFDGWFADEAGEIPWDFDVNTVAADVTIYAKWTTTVTYQITFNSQGGNTVSSVRAETGTSITTPTVAMTRSGYTFGGWFKETACTNVWTFATDVVTADITLFAKWTPDPYTITYVNAGTMTSTAYNIEAETFIISTPTKTGYTFTGWTGTGLTAATPTVTITKGTTTGDKTYTANWTPTPYSITYEGGGTANPANPTTYTIESDDFTLNNPTRDGYSFAGWTGTGLTAATSTVQIVKGSTGARTYDATWSLTSFGITYNLDNGTNSLANPATYNFETATFTLTAPTKTGYTFTGWTGANGTTPQTTVQILKGTFGGKTYTANWQINYYDVVLRLYHLEIPDEGATMVLETQSIAYGGTATAPTTPTTRIGYTFDGWYKEPPTTSQVTAWVFATDVITDTVTIYAKWNPVVYNITYVLDGGTADPANPATYTAAAALTLTNPTKSGFTFLGWTEGDGTVKQMTMTIPIRTTGDKTFTAHWESSAYVFTGNSGVYPDSRDDKSYKWVRIGTQIWMAENLNYTPTNTTSYSRCYDDKPANCNTYGRLYTWDAAMDGMGAATTANPIVQGACPVGWHVPTNAEWGTLISYVGSDAAKKLASTTGWVGKWWEGEGNGTDQYGFNALPGGRNESSNNPSVNSPSNVYQDDGYWWTSTDATGSAYYRNMHWDDMDDEMTLTSGSIEKGYSLSVRCVADGN